MSNKKRIEFRSNNKLEKLLCMLCNEEISRSVSTQICNACRSKLECPGCRVFPDSPHHIRCIYAKCQFCQTPTNKGCACGKNLTQKYEGTLYLEEIIICRKFKWFKKWDEQLQAYRRAEFYEPNAIEDIQRAHQFLKKNSIFFSADRYIID